MPFITLDNIKIFYILHRCPACKNSQTIILVHGAGGNHLSLLNIFHYIKKMHGNRYNILIFDLPMHFRSVSATSVKIGSEEAFREKSNTGYYPDILNRLCAALENISGKLILIGHSMGGMVCLEFAGIFPEKTDRVLVFSGCFRTGIKEAFIKSLEKHFDRTIKLFLTDAWGSGDKNILANAMRDIKRTPPPTIIRDFKLIKDLGGNDKKIKTILNSLNNNKIFVKFIYSENDRIINANCVKELKEAINGSAISKIDCKNHMEIIMDSGITGPEIDEFIFNGRQD